MHMKCNLRELKICKTKSKELSINIFFFISFDYWQHALVNTQLIIISKKKNNIEFGLFQF